MKNLKCLLILLLLVGIVYVNFPDYLQKDLDYFRDIHNAEIVFFMKSNEDSLKLSRLSGPDKSRKIWEKRPVDIYDKIKEPTPACLGTRTESIQDSVYREYLNKLKVTFIILCPVGEYGIVGSGFLETPDMQVLEDQKELARVIEYKVWN